MEDVGLGDDRSHAILAFSARRAIAQCVHTLSLCSDTETGTSTRTLSSAVRPNRFMAVIGGEPRRRHSNVCEMCRSAPVLRASLLRIAMHGSQS